MATNNNMRRGPPARNASDPPPPNKLSKPGTETPELVADAPSSGSGGDDTIARIMAGMGALLTTNLAPIQKTQQEHGVRLDGAESRIEELEKQMAALRGCVEDTAGRTDKVAESIEANTTKQQKTEGELRAVQRELALAAEGAAPPILPPAGWDRPVCAWIAKLSSPQLVSLEAAKDAVKELLADANVHEDEVEWVVEGSTGDLSKKFKMLFKGEPRLAARRCSQALGAMRLPQGWRRMVAKTPEGDGATTPVYMEADKSDKTLQHERLTRRARDACRALKAGENFYIQRSTQQILHSYRAVVRVQLHGPRDEDARLEFQMDKLAELGLEKNAIIEAFKAAGSAQSAPWSV